MTIARRHDIQLIAFRRKPPCHSPNVVRRGSIKIPPVPGGKVRPGWVCDAHELGAALVRPGLRFKTIARVNEVHLSLFPNSESSIQGFSHRSDRMSPAQANLPENGEARSK